MILYLCDTTSPKSVTLSDWPFENGPNETNCKKPIESGAICTTAVNTHAHGHALTHSNTI